MTPLLMAIYMVIAAIYAGYYGDRIQKVFKDTYGESKIPKIIVLANAIRAMLWPIVFLKNTIYNLYIILK
jgi:hypothetical protein